MIGEKLRKNSYRNISSMKLLFQKHFFQSLTKQINLFSNIWSLTTLKLIYLTFLSNLPMFMHWIIYKQQKPKIEENKMVCPYIFVQIPCTYTMYMYIVHMFWQGIKADEWEKLHMDITNTYFIHILLYMTHIL